MQLKKDLIYFSRFARKFGISSGAALFANIKRNRLQSIKLPHLPAPIALRKNTSDLETFYQIFLYDEYDTHYIPNPKVIIDGGANVGLFAVWIKNRFPDATVISVEPDPGNFELVKQNVAAYPNVHVENKGIWSRTTRLKVYDKYNRGKWGFVVEEDNEGSIEAISISDIMAKYGLERIDILKLDIETSEKKVFSENYEDWLPKTKMLIVEIHDHMEEGCAKPFFEAINRTISNYTYLVKGENTVIINNDLD